MISWKEWKFHDQLEDEETQFLSHWYDATRKNPKAKVGIELGSAALGADALTTGPKRRFF